MKTTIFMEIHKFKISMFLIRFFSILFSFISFLCYLDCNKHPINVEEKCQLVIKIYFPGELTKDSEESDKKSITLVGNDMSSDVRKFSQKNVFDLKKTKNQLVSEQIKSENWTCNPTIEVDEVVVRVHEQDGSLIIDETLPKKLDGSFQGIINISVGENRIVKAYGFFNDEMVLAGEKSNVKIEPGRTTPVEIFMSLLPGIEREIIVLVDSLSGFMDSIFEIEASVTDIQNVGIGNVDVGFQIIFGEASIINPFTQDEVSSVFLKTDSEGKVKTLLRFGQKLGNGELEVYCKDRTGDHLIGSPKRIPFRIIPFPPPQIINYDPIVAFPDSVVNISGDNFDIPNLNVRIGNIQCDSVYFESKYNIQIVVPENAVSGQIVITTAGGLTVSSSELIIIRRQGDLQTSGDFTGIAYSEIQKELYVADRANNRIIVLNTESLQEQPSINLAEYPEPYGIALASLENYGELLFCVTQFRNDIVVFSLRFKKIMFRFSLGETYYNPENIVVSEDGAFGYIGADSLIFRFQFFPDSIEYRFTQVFTAGSDPHGLALGLNNKILLVSNLVSNDISVFYTNNNEFIRSIPVGNRPQYILTSDDEQVAYISNSLDNSVSVINLSNLEVIDVFTTDLFPEGMAVSSDNRILFVVNAWDNNIAVINLRSGEIVTTLQIGFFPNLIIKTLSRRLFITNRKSQTISVIDF